MKKLLISAFIFSMMGLNAQVYTDFDPTQNNCVFDEEQQAYYCFDPDYSVYYYYYPNGYYYYPDYGYWGDGRSWWKGDHNWWGRYGFHQRSEYSQGQRPWAPSGGVAPGGVAPGGGMMHGGGSHGVAPGGGGGHGGGHRGDINESN